MGILTSKPHNKPMLNIKVGADFDLYIVNDDLDAKAEVHALMTLHQHVVQRMRELRQTIADPESLLTKTMVG